MSSRHQALIAAARRQHGEIAPCAGKRTLEDCFTREPGYGLLLWFNDASGTTRLMQERARLREITNHFERAMKDEEPNPPERANIVEESMRRKRVKILKETRECERAMVYEKTSELERAKKDEKTIGNKRTISGEKTNRIE